MKRFINILCAAAALCVGLQGCKQAEPEQMDSVDLRYRVSGSLELAATGARPFSLVVTSSKPWTVRSLHPDWCIISDEEGNASSAELVKVGKGEKTTINVQYYDNLDLDDRIDYIEISSNGWTPKKLTVTQKGTAYLEIPAAELTPEMIAGAGEEVQVHISSNQKWSAKVNTGKDWFIITDGETGEGDGVVTITAANNGGEIRYASLSIFDRHDKKVYTINYTQDGVQLDLEGEEIMAAFDQTEASLKVVSNAKWTAVKDNEADTWYTITTPEVTGSGTLAITLEPNDTPNPRVGGIIVRTVPEEEDGFVLERRIAVKQAYEVTPVWVPFDESWLQYVASDWTTGKVTAVANGLSFDGKGRLHNSKLPFGTYTFRWSSISEDAKVRHWIVYGSDDTEMKFNLSGGKTSLEFNKGKSEAPSGLSSVSGLDMSQPHEFTYKFDPSGALHCKVTFMIDGISLGSFNSSDTVMKDVLWGSPTDLYIGIETGKAVCEGYWYTEPVAW